MGRRNFPAVRLPELWIRNVNTSVPFAAEGRREPDESSLSSFGGLDSLLATRLVMEQGVEVIALHFITPFFGYQKKGQEERYQENWKRLYGISARIIDVSDDYFRMLRSPKYGYGKNFNPCIDCKIFLPLPGQGEDGGGKGGFPGHRGSVGPAAYVSAEGHSAGHRTGFRDRRPSPPAALRPASQANPPGN